MSMGDSKKETIIVDGKKRTNRIPQKTLNPYIKSSLLTTLKRDDIEITTHRTAGTDETTVKNSGGKYLFSYLNAWDYGYYCVYAANPSQGGEKIMVAEMDWYEADHNTNQQQQDIFDIGHAITQKQRELETIKEARKTLTPEEIQVLQALGISK